MKGSIRNLMGMSDHGRRKYLDNLEDPNALHNLADDPAQASLLERFRKEMTVWMRTYEDPLIEKYEDYLENGIRYLDPVQEG